MQYKVCQLIVRHYFIENEFISHFSNRPICFNSDQISFDVQGFIGLRRSEIITLISDLSKHPLPRGLNQYQKVTYNPIVKTLFYWRLREVVSQFGLMSSCFYFFYVFLAQTREECLHAFTFINQITYGTCDGGTSYEPKISCLWAILIYCPYENFSKHVFWKSIILGWTQNSTKVSLSMVELLIHFS